MDALLSAAESILRRSPAPALALSHLSKEVEVALGGTTLDPLHLLAGLRCHPDRFKILDPGRGPWRFVTRGPNTGSDEPWVVSLHDPEAPTDGYLADRLAHRLRESVRSVAASVDPESPREVLRWHAMALEGAALARILGKKAA